MKTSSRILFWQCLDTAGLERLELTVGDDRIEVKATTIGVEDGGFRVDHRFDLRRPGPGLLCGTKRALTF